MKKKSKRTWLLMGLIVAGCTKDALSALSDLYFPDFSNGWTVSKGHAEGIFFLNSKITDSSKAKGTIEGEDQRPSDFSLKVEGSFTSLDVKLTIFADSVNLGGNPASDSSFTGKYDTLAVPHMLRLINNAAPHDSLVLQHG